MKDIINRAVKNVMGRLLTEGTAPEIFGNIPSESFLKKYCLAHGYDFDDFVKIDATTYKRVPKKEKKRQKKVFLGRKKGETEEEYLARVRELNPKFANLENEIKGEEWRPIVNTGRYFGGTSDYTKTHEVSNMGRIREIDFNDPMNSRISVGYETPTRNAMQYHLDVFDEKGNPLKTTPPIHTLVADAWLTPPPGDIKNYDVVHINGDYHDNRAVNLKYVLKKGNRGKKRKDDQNLNCNVNMNKKLIRLTESDLHKIVKESVSRMLKEARKNRPLQDDEFPTASYQGETYTIDDPLPDAPIYIHYTGAPYAWNAYPNNGESLRDYIEGRGESMEDIKDWWIGN